MEHHDGVFLFVKHTESMLCGRIHERNSKFENAVEAKLAEEAVGFLVSHSGDVLLL